jgi:hypothetical protein
MPSTRSVCRAAAVTLLTATAFLGAGLAAADAAGAATAAPAASVPNPDYDPIGGAVFDAVWPTFPGDETEFSDSERAAGLLGLNEDPGGPLGSWPRPANPDADASYGAIPGFGPWGTVSGALGVTPRTPYNGGHTDTPDRIALNPAPGPADCGTQAECSAAVAMLPVYALVPPQQD